MKTWWAVAMGVAGGLLASGLILLVSSPPRGERIHLEPPPTRAPLVIHVTGAVKQPGLYTLAVDSRIQDALNAAGGLLPEADPQALNLAAHLNDGDRISIPTQRPTISPAGNAGTPGTAVPGSEYPPSGAAVNINTASQSELESLPGIGPVTAQKIIAHRETMGFFTSIEAIQDVSGIGPATFEAIKELITIQDAP